MRALLVGAALLALAAPAARAQQGDGPAPPPASGQTEPGRFVVYFGFDSAALDPAGRRAVAEAADAYRSTGEARVAVTGYADAAGPADYNQALSERRAEAVRRELVRLGVPDAAIATAGRGEQDLAVPTPDGVPEARNRRVAIELPPPEAAPAVAAAPPPAEPAAAPAKRPGRFSFTLGPVYGHNFQEKDKGRTADDFGGAELRFDALPGLLGGLALKQDVLWAFNTADDGLAGRTVVSLDFAPDLGFVRPHLSANVGGVYGHGVQAGLVAGPELALDLNLIPGFTLRPKVAYDYQFRNRGWDEGILWTGLDLGLRF